MTLNFSETIHPKNLHIMKKIILLAATLLLAFNSTAAPKTQKKAPVDYSKIHGVCYLGWRSDEATIRQQLGYGLKIGLNSTRIWLGGYDRDPEGFIKGLQNYMRIADDMSYSVMPILFNGNGLNPEILKDENWPAQEKYVRATVNALKGEKGLLCWDIMNEPTCNDYYKHAPSQEIAAQRAEEIFRFVRKVCQLIKEIAPENDITVGVTYPKFIEMASPDLVDVISFHDYRETKAIIRENYDIAKAAGEKYGKQIVNSEMGCIGRSNPYDLALQIADEYGAGWYLFELMVGGGWGEIHGIFYPDGTVRDPAIAAACLGIYRNRDLSTMIREKPNREGYADEAIRRIKESFKENKEVFKTTSASTNDILEACEWAANILEGAQMVPMCDMPSAKIEAWRKQAPAERDTKAIRQFAYHLVELLEQNCEIFD